MRPGFLEKTKPSTFSNQDNEMFMAYKRGLLVRGKCIILMEDNIPKEFNLKEVETFVLIQNNGIKTINLERLRYSVPMKLLIGDFIHHGHHGIEFSFKLKRHFTFSIIYF